MKIYEVIVSDLAKLDLQDIVSYISQRDSHARAKHVEHGILSKAKVLSRFPEGYPKDPYASTETQIVRFAIKWKYKILFVIENDMVQVVGIFHTAQTPEKLTSKKLFTI